MIHVAYVLARFPVLSETFVSGEVLELERRGARVDLYSILRGEPAGEPAVEALATRTRYLSDLPRAGATVRALFRLAGGRVRVRPALPLGARRALRFLPWALAIRDSGATHIHAHFANVPTEIARILARMTGLPFSFTCHAKDIFPASRELPLWASEASTLVTVCDYNRREIVRAFPSIPAGKIEIVICGVDPDRFVRRRPYSARPFHVLAVGRLVEKKGFVHLIRALGLLEERGIRIPCRIVGEGPARGELGAEIQKRALGQLVRLEGQVDRGALREAFEWASVLVMPAVVARDGDRDSMPVVIKEAMAMEIPTLGTREVAIPEVVDDGTGWLVPPADPEALAETLAAASRAEPERLAAMGRRGRQVVLERFTLGGEVAKLERIFARSVR